MRYSLALYRRAAAFLRVAKVQPGLQLLLAGIFWSSFALAADGDLDPNFGTDGQVILTGIPGVYQGLFGKAVVVDPAGRLLIAGKSWDSKQVVTRLLDDGSVDVSFGSGGAAAVAELAGDYFPTAIAVDAAGNSVFVGSTSSLGLFVIRVTVDGEFDPSFGDQGRVDIPRQSLPSSVRSYDVAIQPDGKVLIAAEFAVIRLEATGAVDSAFGSNGSALMPAGSLTRGIALQSDGKIIAVGNNTRGFFGTTGEEDYRVVRFTPEGQLDSAFGVDGMVVSDFVTGEEAASDVIVDPQDRILVSGVVEHDDCTVFSQCFKPVVARYLENGTLDTGFGSSGFATIDVPFAYVNDMLLQPDGSIVTSARATSGDVDVNGQCTDESGLFITVFRQLADGGLDTGFGCSGAVHTRFPPTKEVSYGVSFNKRGLVILPDGKIVALGRFQDSQGDATAVIRILARDDDDNGFSEPWDLTPDPLQFDDVPAAFADAPQLSNPVSISGLEDGFSVPLRVVGGEATINGSGTFFSLNPAEAALDPGTVDQQNFAGDDVFLANAAYTGFNFQQVVTAGAAGRLTRVKFRYYRPTSDPTYGPTPDTLDIYVGIANQWVDPATLTTYRVDLALADPGPGEILVNVADAGIDLVPGMQFVIGWQGTDINNFPALYFENGSYPGGELWMNGERFGDPAEGYADVRFETWVNSTFTASTEYGSYAWVKNGDLVQVRHQSGPVSGDTVHTTASAGGLLLPNSPSTEQGATAMDVFTSTTGDPNTDDSDGDGVVDVQDAFPNDPTEWFDTDNDGIGNNADPDDNNDGVLDSQFADITTLSDVTGDLVPDLAGFVEYSPGRPRIAVYSGDNGDRISSIDYINDKWLGFGLATARDGNQDNTADDPALSMLVVNKTTFKIRVESRDAASGALLSSIQFFNENWRAIDVVVVDDLNGDGNSDDSAVAVLAERISDGRIQLQLRDLGTGNLVSNTVYLNARWQAIAAAVANRAGLPPVIGVIAHNTDNSKRTLQSRVAGSGAFDQNMKFLGSTWNYLDVSVNHDANGDGTADDPVWLVLAVRPADNVIRVQSKFVANGAFDDNILILNSNWEGFRLDAANDISGNNAGEMAISAIKRADGVRRIHVKDYGTGATTINVAP